MMDLHFSFEARLWVWQGPSAWYFVTLPSDVADEIRFFTSEQMGGAKRRGFGSVRVSVQLDDEIWATSVFPDKKSGSYLLPVKAAIRKGANWHLDDVRLLHLKIKPD